MHSSSSSSSPSPPITVNSSSLSTSKEMYVSHHVADFHVSVTEHDGVGGVSHRQHDSEGDAHGGGDERVQGVDLQRLRLKGGKGTRGASEAVPDGTRLDSRLISRIPTCSDGAVAVARTYEALKNGFLPLSLWFSYFLLKAQHNAKGIRPTGLPHNSTTEQFLYY